DFLALNKPSGMLSIPDRFSPGIPSLSVTLQKRFPEIYTVHRLDRDSSGLILFAKTKSYHQWLSGVFESRKVEKEYLGIVVGILPNAAGTIDLPITTHPVVKGKMIAAKNGKPSRTDYEVAEQFKSFSLLKLRIHTGRTHQIRVHLATLGFPLVGDSLYGNGRPVLLSHLKPGYKKNKNEEQESPLLSRLALHAFRLTFPDPEGIRINLEAPLMKDMRALLQQLRKVNSLQE
ncbi:MAG TPA: RluA family pseudouridine synthase, partial [Chitinophagaceae bacterium]|nr:RluA family pseudouridine synthase [Chitinophagaceae bacterium]